MKANNTLAILATARGVETLLPLISHEQSITEWAQALAGESVTTRQGREISAARAALNGAQFAMTNIAMALRSATELGMLPYTKATAEVKRVYTLLDTLRSAFAGVRNEAHRELTVAELTLLVKDGAFDGVQSSHAEPYTEEELVDMGLGWDAIEDILTAQEAGMHLHQPDLSDTSGGWSEDEGMFRTSVHSPTQLWDIELRDVQFAEFHAAPVALIGLDWPTQHPMWEPLLDRLADTWQAAIEYADDKDTAARKVERREAVLEDLHAKPVMARWVINHITRRVWRDMEMLKLRREDVLERLDWVERRAMQEERYNVPSQVTRVGTGEHQEYERKAYLMYLELSEAETARHAEHDTQVERDRAWAEAQREAIDNLLAGLGSLYQALRTMDLKLTKLWELFAENDRPAEPPLYWSKDRYFLAHEEDAARAQVRIEAAMAKQKAREAEGDALMKAAALVADMLGL